MICPFCGKLGQDSHAFCLYCGAVNPRRAPLSADSIILSEAVPSADDGTKWYETHDLTGLEWRSGAEPDSGRPVRDGAQYIPLGIHDATSFNGAEWHDACDRQGAEIVQTPILSLSLPDRENPSPPFIDSGNSVSDACLYEAEILPPSFAAPPQSEEEHLQSVLNGAYTIIRKLGAGGMANVYLAREISLDREVAIKVLPRAHLGDQQFTARFHREARLSAMLEHPHIVRIYHIGDAPDLCYFVMNYIPGGALSDRMRNGRIVPVRDIVRWGADICSALAYAHDHGVIHRDLKPDNIMLDRRNRAVVTDFGIAHALRGTGLTQTGAVIGTPQYMSPDQALGKIPDARSDIYSLGMVLYQMTAGTLPFRASDPVALMYMHVHKVPQPPEAFNPNLPRWLQDIILRCLAKKPSERFPNAVELRRALLAGDSVHPAHIPEKQENDRGIHSIIDAAVHLVSSAVSSRWSKESSLSSREVHVHSSQIDRPRHSLKMPRNINPV